MENRANSICLNMSDVTHDDMPNVLSTIFTSFTNRQFQVVIVAVNAGGRSDPSDPFTLIGPSSGWWALLLCGLHHMIGRSCGVLI